MIIESSRLILREWQESDIDDLVEGLNNINVSKWMASIPFPYTQKDATDFINYVKNEDVNKHIHFAIVLKENNKVIGGTEISNINIKDGIAGGGIWLNEKYQKNGYGTEAFCIRNRYIFNELGLRKIENGYFPNNEKSHKMQLKLGYKDEGIRRKRFLCMATGEYVDECITGLFKEDFIDMYKNDIDKIKDAIVGFAVGDALGVPVEFRSRTELKKNPVITMREYGTYNVPRGTWSDDTSMTLATIDSIIEKQTIDVNDIAIKFLGWLRNEEYTATDECFDIGRTTLQALVKFETYLDNASKCGETGEFSNGNGSLMRILPIAYYIYYKRITDDKKIYEIVKEVSSITHSHEISVLGCYIYVKYVLELLNDVDKVKAYKTIQQSDYSMFSDYAVSKYDRILKSNIQNLDEDSISSSGYVVSTLEAVMWLFLNSKDYNSTILKAVNLGDDTDTVAAIAGGLLGIEYGINCIKDEWKEQLKRYDYIIDLCDKFEKNIL